MPIETNLETISHKYTMYPSSPFLQILLWGNPKKKVPHKEKKGPQDRKFGPI